MELESVREWLAEIKLFVENLLEDNNINLCTLSDFIDTMNAVQLFIYNNFLDPNVLTKGFLEIWPAWYRLELNHAVDHLERSWTTVLVELGSVDKLDSPEKCKRFGEFYRKEYANKPKKWDLCPKCTKQTGKVSPLSLRESYNRIVKDAKDFESLRQKIERDNSNLPDPIIKAPEQEFIENLKTQKMSLPVQPPPTITLSSTAQPIIRSKPHLMTRSSSLRPVRSVSSRSRSD